MTTTEQLRHRAPDFIHHREAEISIVRAEEGTPPTFEISFASDYAVTRWGWREILDIAGADLGRMNARAAVLLNHTLNEAAGGQVGVCDRAWADGNKLRAQVRFSRSVKGQEVQQDVEDLIRVNVSVGYRVTRWEIDEDKREETAREWEPYEISFVGVPADPTVGVGRQLDPGPERRNRQEEDMPEETKPGAEEGAETRAPATHVDPEKVREEERQRIRSIDGLGRKFGQAELADEAIRDGSSVADFNEKLLERLEADSAGTENRGRGAVVEEELVQLGALDQRTVQRDGGFLTPVERGRFSFVRLLRALDPQASRAAEEAAAFELEVCQESSRRQGAVTIEGSGNPREFGRGNIPYEVLAHRGIDELAPALRERVQMVNTGASGGALVETALLAGSFIDNLRNMSAFLPRVMMLQGLVGNIDVPYKSQSTTGGWIGEDAEATASDITVGIHALTPKTYAGRSAMSRRSLQQTTPGIEALVRADLARTHAIAVDEAVAFGTGASNQPKGITVVTGIGASTYVKADGPTYAGVLGMEETVEVGNALFGDLAFISHPKWKNALRQKQRFSGSASPVWTDDNTVIGHTARSSNQVKMSVAASDGDCIFGNWSDVIVASWATLDLIVDPYSDSSRGRLNITSFSDWDFLLRHAKSVHWQKSAA